MTTFAPIKLNIVTFNNAKVMKKDDLTNTFSKKVQKMTLKDYYSSLPEASCPKTDFLNDVAERCGVSLSTVRNWIRYGMKPSNPNHIDILVDITGIKAEELWTE